MTSWICPICNSSKLGLPYPSGDIWYSLCIECNSKIILDATGKAFPAFRVWGVLDVGRRLNAAIVDRAQQLELVREHVKTGEANVERQMELVEALHASGHYTDLAESTLQLFK